MSYPILEPLVSQFTRSEPMIPDAIHIAEKDGRFVVTVGPAPYTFETLGQALDFSKEVARAMAAAAARKKRGSRAR